MHRSSYEKMAAFRDAYLNDFRGTSLSILDIGSASVFGENDGYRPLFANPNWHYRGLDMAANRNVDVVVANPYDWSVLDDASFDIVVSGQAFEHIAWPWLTMMEIARILKPRGLAAIIAPSAGHVHRFPLDCWRFYPDGFPALAAYAGLTLVEQHIDQGYAFPESAFWGDVFVVLRQQERSAAADALWRRRYIAAMESVVGVDPFSGPAKENGAEAIRKKEIETLDSLDQTRVKAGLILDVLYRAWRIFRTPLKSLPRT